jgi:hypothetical protein
MTYLDMALAALTECEKSEKSEISLLLGAIEAERLKAEIVAAATVEPAEFDRGALDALWARWSAHEAAGGAP